MWRKSTEPNPSSQPIGAPGPTSIKSEDLPRTPALQTPLQSAPVISAPVCEPPAASIVRNVSQISSGLKIRGELSGDSDLYIDGDVQGKIHLPKAHVTVGSNGRVQAEIEAREIIVDGSVEGDLKAYESVHLGSSSRVIGSLVTPRIGIEDGAQISGKVEMARAGQPAKTPAAERASGSEELRPITAGVKGE